MDDSGAGMGDGGQEGDPLVMAMGAAGAAMPVSYWVRQLAIGIWMVVGLGVIVTAYAILAGRPAAPVLIATATVEIAVTTAAFVLLPLDRIIARRATWVFTAASGAVLLAIIGMLAIDNRPSSPLALLFIAPIVYASAIYPPRLALTICTVTVSTVAGMAIGFGVLDPAGADPSGAAVYVLLLIWLSVGGVTLSHRQWVAAGRMQGLLREVSEAAAADGLTGCLSADAFRTRLAAVAATDRTAIAMIDLDDFKAINDVGGHAAGDRVLVETGRALRAVVRDGDIVGRLGGDEFAIIFSSVDPEHGPVLLARIRTALGPVAQGSVGLAFGDATTDGKALLRHADAAMYRDKRTRRSSRGRAASAVSTPPEGTPTG